jgi:ribosomal-protein-alanine N-acetyltransferase
MPDACQVLNIVVDLPFRGLGLAKLMLRRAIDRALKEGIGKVTLDVRKSNLPAVQLYQSLNFAIDHIRKGFYSNGEDAYQMTLHIKDDVIHPF